MYDSRYAYNSYIYILLSLTLSRPRSGLSISKLQVADSEREQEEPEEHENDSDSDEETDLLPNARCRGSRFFFPFFPAWRSDKTQHNTSNSLKPPIEEL